MSYGSYIPPKRMDQLGVIIYSAGDIIRGDANAMAALNGQIVIVGAAWSSAAYGRGAMIDLHSTPVGRMVGAKSTQTLQRPFLIQEPIGTCRRV